MVELQEFFGSRDNKADLERKLNASGFVLDLTSPIRLFSAQGANVSIQPINNKSAHIAGVNPVPWGFVLQLDKPLKQFYSGHPLRTFFAALDQPNAYGLMGMKPKHIAQAYLP